MSWEQALATLIVVPMLIFFYVAFSLNERHIVLRLFFFIFGLGMLGIGLMYSSYLISVNITGALGEKITFTMFILYNSIWWVILPYFAVYLLITVFRILSNALKKKGTGQEWKAFDV